MQFGKYGLEVILFKNNFISIIYGLLNSSVTLIQGDTLL